MITEGSKFDVQAIPSDPPSHQEVMVFEKGLGGYRWSYVDLLTDLRFANLFPKVKGKNDKGKEIEEDCPDIKFHRVAKARCNQPTFKLNAENVALVFARIKEIS